MKKSKHPGIKWISAHAVRKLPRRHCCAAHDLTGQHSHSNSPLEKPLRDAGHVRALLAILIINLVMCGFEVVYGFDAKSTSLLADALDLASHIFLAIVSILAVRNGERWKIRAALFKGMIMAGLGLSILIDAIHRVGAHVVPDGHTMSAVAAVGLIANLICLAVLFRHREDDLNIRSTWLCSRNDVIADVATLLTSVLVLWRQSAWPDMVFGSAVALLVISSSVGLTLQALRLLKTVPSGRPT
jgi:cation diffusion facilitator family transporter